MSLHLVVDDEQRRRACTRGNASPARSGLPPRETTAPISRGRNKGRSCASARTKIADPQMACPFLLEDPPSCVDKPLGWQTNIEPVPCRVDVLCFLFRCEQIKKQCREIGSWIQVGSTSTAGAGLGCEFANRSKPLPLRQLRGRLVRG